MGKTLIYLDEHHQKDSIGLLAIADRIRDGERMEVHGVVFGQLREAVEEYFDQIHQFEVSDDRCHDVRWKAEHIRKLQEEMKYSCIVIPATREGRMLAPVLAVKLQSGLVADVTEVEYEDGKVQMIRPAFDGKLMAKIINRDSDFVMMSVRPGAFHYEGAPKKNPRVILHRVEESKCQIRLMETIELKPSIDIRDAKVLVSGGGGVMDNFHELKELAKPLHGMVSASRRVVDSGIAPRSIQVGQSGKIVSPKLYFALGIYGSLQHIEGLQNVEDIIAVNTNKNAPICSLSTIVVEGDAIEFKEELLKIIKNNENPGGNENADYRF